MSRPSARAPRTQPRIIGNLESWPPEPEDARLEELLEPVSAVAPKTEEVARCEAGEEEERSVPAEEVTTEAAFERVEDRGTLAEEDCAAADEVAGSVEGSDKVDATEAVSAVGVAVGMAEVLDALEEDCEADVVAAWLVEEGAVAASEAAEATDDKMDVTSVYTEYASDTKMLKGSDCAITGDSRTGASTNIHEGFIFSAAQPEMSFGHRFRPRQTIGWFSGPTTSSCCSVLRIQKQETHGYIAKEG